MRFQWQPNTTAGYARSAYGTDLPNQGVAGTSDVSRTCLWCGADFKCEAKHGEMALCPGCEHDAAKLACVYCGLGLSEDQIARGERACRACAEEVTEAHG